MHYRALTVLLASFAAFSAGPELDLSTPKAAAKSLYEAVEAQDGAAILRTFYAADDSERELAGAFSDLILAGKKLHDAARDKYGTVGEALGSGMMSKDDFARLDQAEVKETGDTATLTTVGRAKPIVFHKTGNQWQLVVRDFANAETDLPPQAALLKKVGGVFNDLAGEIAAGKYATSPEAESVIQTRLATVMIRAATQAATREATTKP